MLANLLDDTFPYSSFTVFHSAEPFFLISVPPLPPGWPPKMAQGLTSCRSLHWLPVIGTSVANSVRRYPRPPRHLPAPPESVTSSQSSTRSGKRVSNTSVGLNRQLPLMAMTQSLPSWPYRPPQPPDMMS